MGADSRGINHGINICGSSANDPMIGKKVDVTLKHNNDSLELLFGSTLKASPCFASFGVSNLEVYVL